MGLNVKGCHLDNNLCEQCPVAFESTQPAQPYPLALEMSEWKKQNMLSSEKWEYAGMCGAG